MRLDHFPIGFRIIAGFVAMLLVAVAIIVPYLLDRLDGVIQEAEQRELRSLHGNLMATLDAEGRRGSAMSALVALIPEVQQAFAEQRRDRLAELFVPGFKTLREQYGIAQFQFHLPPATSFLRVHGPDKFGDDLSAIRQTIIETNRSQQPITGLERGVFGLGIRSLQPVQWQGQHIGSLEFGMSFGQDFFERFEEQFGAGAALRLREGNGFTTFASTFGDQPLLSKEALEAALNGEQPIEDHFYEETPVAVMGAVVRDFSGQPVGVLEVTLDRTSYIARANTARNAALFIIAVTMGIGILLAFLISQTITGPIKRTAAAMGDIAEGEADLTQRLDASGQDELSELARQFNAFVSRMQLTLQDVRDSARSVYETSGSIARSSEDLASRSDEAAANLQQTSAAMEEIAATVAHGADSAHQATALSASASEAATQGSTGMQELRTTMKDIDQASSRITDIVTLIDGIAFQTNILALNASVEAARAGEHGRGFAVVAQEVRTLAERSRQAAREIRDVTEESVKTSRLGLNKVEQASAAMNKILESISNVNDVLEEISASTREQSSAVAEVNTAVTELDTVTQQNAAMVNQTSSSAAQMRSLAEHLNALIDAFELGATAEDDRSQRQAALPHRMTH
ncbi:MAG: methyl-accepting chemotaxis protein [Lamprobacter sp.]|uniref:methyl-accepting chemotaxis protein n=1 Tax=Lamprobacter sp. TaxID=3100796 RepID=UPI002B25AC75|nr:methyl-accepting chemotaxis protein [Lamprobacter sp.]MEA3639773.1 methyl-accepting chemotaxis protein [Lamprobacter sp.]